MRVLLIVSVALITFVTPMFATTEAEHGEGEYEDPVLERVFSEVHRVGSAACPANFHPLSELVHA